MSSLFLIDVYALARCSDYFLTAPVEDISSLIDTYAFENMYMGVAWLLLEQMIRSPPLRPKINKKDVKIYWFIRSPGLVVKVESPRSRGYQFEFSHR